MRLDRSASRRAWLGAAVAGAAGWLAGCAGAPSAPAAAPAPAPAPAAPPSRAQQLQALGFRLTDAGWEFSLTGRMLFDSDSDVLDPDSLATAQRLGRELGRLGVQTVRVEGHTDSTGGQAYNQALSLRRARAVASVMAQAGLQGAQIQTVGLGKAAPINDNRTPEERQQNRRVAVILPVQ